MKQTAVEWFFNELYSIRKTIPFEQQTDAILKAFEQAKEMEMKQIMDAYSKGHIESSWGRFAHSEQYYNETFKST